MEKKTFYSHLTVKLDSEKGEFEAVFATLNVIDLDDDVTLSNAFGEQEVIIESWNHNYQKLPVGKGIISEVGDDVIVKGRFFLETQAGKDHYIVAKELGGIQEWSYTFNIIDSAPGEMYGRDVRYLKKLEVVGVGQVAKGAGINTRTTAIKGQKRAIAPHSTATSEAAWDGPTNEARLRTEETAGYYRKAYAWNDPDGDPETKAAYRFIHHMVGQGGDVGAANIRACQTGIGVLNGARGGTTIPEADRRGVYNHLARHIRDADLEPPELKALEVGGDSTPPSPPCKGGSNDVDEGEIVPEGNDKPSADILTEINFMEIRMIVAGSEE